MPDTAYIPNVLTSVKKALGLSPDYTPFDADIIMHINTVFGILYQMGVGPSTPFTIRDDTALWSDFQTQVGIDMVQTFIYLRVRMLFDPPTGTVAESFNNTIDELTWRLNVEVETRCLKEGSDGVLSED